MGGFRPYNALLTDTIEAQSNIQANRFVDFSGAQVTSLGARVKGVSRYSGISGDDIAVDVVGFVSVEAAGAITAGTVVVSDNQGRAIPHPGAAEIGAGVAHTSVTAAGSFVKILLT